GVTWVYRTLRALSTNPIYPLWESAVAEEAGAYFSEHEEDDSLNDDERLEMNKLRDRAIDEISTYLDEYFRVLHKLAYYLRESPKAHNRLADIQKTKLRAAANDGVNMIADGPARWNNCWKMRERCIHLQPALDRSLSIFFSSEDVPNSNTCRTN
ncbi:hypothetical protein GN958_ATG23582, partial [Phytophthora infestans]